MCEEYPCIVNESRAPWEQRERIEYVETGPTGSYQLRDTSLSKWTTHRLIVTQMRDSGMVNNTILPR